MPKQMKHSEEFDTCLSEAKMIMKIWLGQSIIMIGLFLLLGYYRIDDPFGFPLGIPSWYLFGAIIPAIVGIAVIVFVGLFKMKEIDLS